MATVDLGFPLKGAAVVRNHGYALYGALRRVLPTLHRAAWLGVHPLTGALVEGGTLVLRDSARLFLRVPAERVPDVLPLAGRTIEIAGSPFVLGVPSVSSLVPAASLDARLVVLNTSGPPGEREELGRETVDVRAFVQRYTGELERQLAALGIAAAPRLRGRRSILIAGKRIVGYSVRVSGLSADRSLALQAHGLGGKRCMGCGIFRPTRGR